MESPFGKGFGEIMVSEVTHVLAIWKLLRPNGSQSFLSTKKLEKESRKN